MLSIKLVKELINDPTISDEEAEKIRDEYRALVEIIFERGQAERIKVNSKNKYENQDQETK